MVRLLLVASIFTHLVASTAQATHLGYSDRRLKVGTNEPKQDFRIIEANALSQRVVEVSDLVRAAPRGMRDDTLRRLRTGILIRGKNVSMPGLVSMIEESIERDETNPTGTSSVALAPYTFTPDGFDQIETLEQIQRNLISLIRASLGLAEYSHPTAGDAFKYSCVASFDAGFLAAVSSDDFQVPDNVTMEEMQTELAECVKGGDDVDLSAVFWAGVNDGNSYKASRDTAALER